MSFKKLLIRNSPHVTKQSITRKCTSALDKLIITLRYLATGESFRNLMYNFRIHESTISLFIPVVLKAIYEELKDNYLKVPDISAEWLEIHLLTGSPFFNYKQRHSIVLLAIALSDGGVFWESDLSKALARNCLTMPEDHALPGRTMHVPFVTFADTAFTLSEKILKPHSFKGMSKAQRVFNYKLSRAGRVLKNAFVILASRFLIFLTTIPLSPEKTTLILQASCALHNFLLKENNSQYTSNNQEEVSNQSIGTYTV
ncbi:hypothetical protein HUJ05_007726 [Dendroctonus ponderosae]|nr:hypothetical protein HUJ05_007726 [Dendroctonus ponderosae]